MSEMSLLFVEDEDDLRVIMQDALQSHGYQVSLATDGASALTMLEGDTAYSHVVTDVRMPGEVTGLEVATKALERSPQSRVVLVSGYQRGQLPPLPEGAVFLSKPYRIKQLLLALEEG